MQRFHIKVRFNYFTLLWKVAFFFYIFYLNFIWAWLIFFFSNSSRTICTVTQYFLYLNVLMHISFMIGRIPEGGLNIFGEGKRRKYWSRRGVACSLPSLFLSVKKLNIYILIKWATQNGTVLNCVIHAFFEKIKLKASPSGDCLKTVLKQLLGIDSSPGTVRLLTS